MFDWLNSDFVQALSAAATVVFAGLTYKVLCTQRDLQEGQHRLQEQALHFERTSKRVEAAMHFNTRFADLLLQKLEGRAPAASYFERFWSLQLDQFDAWILGYLPDKLYARWLVQRRSDYVRNRPYVERPDGVIETIVETTFRKGWTDVSREWRSEHGPFVELMDAIMLAKGENIDLLALMAGARLADAKKNEHALATQSSSVVV